MVVKWGGGQGKILSLAVLLCLWGGCAPVTSSSQDVEDGNVGLNPSDFPHRRIQGEPNDSFDQPISIVLNAQSQGQLQGAISTPSDVDVYSLEGLSVGDRIIVDVGTHNDGLDADLAIFDEMGRLILENDDRSTTLQQLDPFINDVIRRESSVYFLVIAQSPLAASPKVGDYEVMVTVVHGGQTQAPESQTVVLNFEGGTITFSPSYTVTVGPFDAGDIAGVYAGKTSQLRSLIATEVRNHYQGLALNVLVNPGDLLPPAGTYSTVLFGGNSSEAFGLSQDVDSYNSIKDDESIVFTSVFRPSQFGRVLTVQELAIAIGNVAAHEMGHLLGLNHTANVRDLMDTTGGSLTLIVEQSFLTSPLDSSIFPIGLQDSMLLLAETLGLTTP